MGYQGRPKKQFSTVFFPYVARLNDWMTKFVQGVAKPSKERYPPKTLFQIVCSIRRYLSEKNLGDQELNPLDSTDKWCSFVSQLIDYDND